jgi:hypothetical protein
MAYTTTLQEALKLCADPSLSVSDELFEGLVLKQLRDARLAASTIVNVDTLQDELADLFDSLKSEYLDIFLDSDVCEKLTALEPSELRDDIEAFLKARVDMLKAWVRETLYENAVTEAEAYWDGGAALSMFQDFKYAYTATGTEDLLDPVFKDTLLSVSMDIVNGLIDDHFGDQFVPLGQDISNLPELQDFLSDITLFRSLRYSLIEDSPTAKPQYEKTLAVIQAQIRDQLNAAKDSEIRSLRNQRLALLGIGSFVGIVGWWYCRKSKREEDSQKSKLDAEMQEYSDKQWARTDWPVYKDDA